MAKTKRSRGPALEDLDLPGQQSEHDDQPLELFDEETKEVITNPTIVNAQWIRAVLNPKLKFFDAITEIPVGGWDIVSIYLYRLEPKVSNREGEGKYIGVYGNPITEETVKAEHGGGKFQLYLKAGKNTLRSHRFWIDGEPIYKEGQTMRGGATPGAPMTGTIVPPQNELAAVVRQVIEATGGNSKAADAGIEILKNAMKDGLELQKTITTNQMNSTTGNLLGDKLLELVLPKLMQPATTDPIILKLVEAAISNMKADRREQNPEPRAQVPATDQLSLVKELLGVDSLAEVINLGGRRGAETPWWVSLLSNAVDRLPTLMREFAEMQERGFQRAIIAHQLGAGQPGTIPAPMVQTESAFAPGAPRAPFAPPAPTPAPVPQGGMSQQMISAIVDGICRAFDEGYPGDVAGAHIRLLYPELVDSLRPLLTDTNQLTTFVSQMPPLAERSQDPEWHGFQQEFIEELSQVPAPPGVIEPPPAPPMAAAAAAGVSRETPSARHTTPKKKVNGSAA